MTIKLLTALTFGGVPVPAGSVVSQAAGLEEELVQRGVAEYVEGATFSPGAQSYTDGSAHVLAPADLPLAYVPFHIADLSNARQKIAIPSGARRVVITYELLPGATAVPQQWGKAVFNAASDSDADGKLATQNAHWEFYQGGHLALNFSASNPCTRVDVIADKAVSTEKTKLRVLVGV